MKSSRWMGAVGKSAVLPGAGLVLALAAPVYGREAVVLLVIAAAAFALRRPVPVGLALGFGYGLLTAVAFARGGAPGVGVAIAAGLLGTAGSARSPRRWPPGLLAATLLGAVVAGGLPFLTSYLAEAPIARAPALRTWPALVACVAAVLLCFARETRTALPRRPLAVGLLVAAATGLWRLGDAASAVGRATRGYDIGALRAAGLKARAAGWSDGEAQARLAEARLHLKAGSAARVLELVPAAGSLDPDARFLRAEALLATGATARAMEELRRALADRPASTFALSKPLAAREGLWRLRWGDAARAGELLSRAGEGPEGVVFLTEALEAARQTGDAETVRRLREELRSDYPQSGLAACAQLDERRTDLARACLAEVPTHAEALRVAAEGGDSASAAALAAGADLRAPSVNLAGVFQLQGGRVSGGPVHRGESIHVEVAAQAIASCAPGERYELFIDLGGPDYRNVPPPVAAPPKCVRGERIVADGPVPIPADARPGPYRVLVGFADPDTGRRLEARGGLAGGTTFEIGTVEVLP